MICQYCGKDIIDAESHMKRGRMEECVEYLRGRLKNAEDKHKMVNEYVVVQSVWSQTSSDYQAERGTRTLIVSGETTVAKIMAWANWKGLGRGDIVLTQADPLPHKPGEEI